MHTQSEESGICFSTLSIQLHALVFFYPITTKYIQVIKLHAETEVQLTPKHKTRNGCCLRPLHCLLLAQC